MHVDQTKGSNVLQWKVITFCILTIIVGHLTEEARAYGWTSRVFHSHWQYVYRLADTSVAIAFAMLVCWFIWFSQSSLLAFFVPVALGLLNWGENELKSRAFFGAFFQTVDWWQWAAIDATLAAIVAILLKPIVRKFALRDGKSIAALSLADLFLATFASAVLIVATRSIATLPTSPELPNVLFCGWPPTLLACATGTLIGCIAAAAVYLLIATSWLRGLAAYGGACVLYLGETHTLTSRSGQLTIKPLELADWRFHLRDPQLAVFLVLAAAMISIRYSDARAARLLRPAHESL